MIRTLTECLCLMDKCFSILLLINCVPLFIYGQSVIATAGGNNNGAGGSISFTVGQPAYTFQSSSGSVNAGVQQPSLLSGLPIQLVEFKAEVNANQTVTLSWTTETEINNDFFTIERSTNGFDWEWLVEVTGAGTTNQTQSYQSIDESPYQGVSYYRLKQTDLDGSFTFSDIQTVLIGVYDIHIYPNPTVDELTLNLSRTNNHETNYHILDARGIAVISGTANNVIHQIDLSRLSSGNYWIRIASDNKLSTIHSFIKLN